MNPQWINNFQAFINFFYTEYLLLHNRNMASIKNGILSSTYSYKMFIKF